MGVYCKNCNGEVSPETRIMNSAGHCFCDVKYAFQFYGLSKM